MSKPPDAPQPQPSKPLERGKTARQRIHLLHIGKTGGMALKFALQPALAAGCHDIVLHPHMFRLQQVPLGEKVVFFLRDPISRFVSAFNSRLRKGRPTMFFPWVPGEKIAFSRFATPNQLAVALSSLDAQAKSEAQHAMRHIIHVNAPFWWWFGGPKLFTARWPDVFFIGFQENLTRDFNHLKDLLGLPDSVALPTDDVMAHKSPAHLESRLEPEAVANLTAWYRLDYQFIALCRHLAKTQGFAGAPARSIRRSIDRNSEVVKSASGSHQRGG